MGGMPGWMPKLLEKINWGCATSPWFADLANEEKILVRGRQIVLDLWPYVRELPLNINAVKSAIPERMTAATQLLNRLSDSELQYQKLFLQQFDLAGISAEEIAAENKNPRTHELRLAMSKMCRQSTYVEGIHAIVAAELAATLYCRSSLPSYEKYFDKHASEYEPGLINAGLEWVRLHAKTYTRHAIWMKNMLNDIEDGKQSSDEIPPAADIILTGVLALWECPVETQQLAGGRIS
jgi:pyrroloquinoline quinone (PQQ) biosynthesis protein C